jgi:alanyl-tRNA synthetase
MHKALREVLGSHVQQKGSLVDGEKTRFDFIHTNPLNREEIEKIEQIVNAEIINNSITSAKSMSIDEAQKTGAMMLFGEKYGDEVRVLEIGSSKELCGGTHVYRTGDIGLFKIVSESGVAAGIRRIEAITGKNALNRVQKLDSQVLHLASILKSPPDEMAQRLNQLQDQMKGLEKELERFKSKIAASQGEELLSQVQEIKGAKTLVAQLDSMDIKALRETLDQVKNKLHSGIVVLATVQEGKVQIIAGVTSEWVTKVKAGELVNFVAQQVDGKGGGKPDMAMAGGISPNKLPQALGSVTDWLTEKL